MIRYLVEITVTQRAIRVGEWELRSNTYIVDAIDDEAGVGQDIMRLVIGHNCLVSSVNYDAEPPYGGRRVYRPDEFYDIALGDLT
jgi:hypothetical protein